MKKGMMIVVMFFAVAWGRGQQLESESKAVRAESYHLKSKHELTAATVLAAGGGVMAITGTILFYRGAIGDPPEGENTSLENTGGVLTTLGVACMAGSVPLFIMGARHRKKYRDLSFDYHWESVPPTGLRGMSAFPAVGLRIGLGVH